MYPSVGGLPTFPPLLAGITYLKRYVVSFAFLLSDFLLTYVLGVESPKAVVPRPTQTVLKISLSVDAVETLTYHCDSEESH